MKAVLSFFFVLISASLFSQTIYLANNNPGAPSGTNVFIGPNALSDAITTSITGDIIQVLPSPNDYGPIVVDKAITIYGIGFNPNNGGDARSIVSNISIEDPAASGARISGLYITEGIFLGGTSGVLQNLLIEKCHVLRVVQTTNLTALYNIIINNNVMASGMGIDNFGAVEFLPGFMSNILVTNNVIYGNTRTDTYYGGVNGRGTLSLDNSSIVEHNLFIGTGTSWRAFHTFSNNIVRNNIFYGMAPISSNAAFTGNSFERNLSYGTASLTFSAINGNQSIGNLEGVNPTFQNVNLTGGIDYSVFDPQLLPGSPAIGSGVNGVDMGIYGGLTAFDLTGTPLPIIEELIVPTKVSQGSDLSIRVKARGN